MEHIYLDHAATSPMHPQVIEKMMFIMNSQFGNPSSIHAFGRKARHIIDEAREGIAKSIQAKANEIIFTSGGTEADNLAVLGIAESYQHNGKHIITTQIEHHAVLHACKQLEKEGYEVTYLPVDETGIISLDDLSQALRPDTILVSVMYGNNEVGSLQPILEVGKLLEEHQAFFHSDAVQAYGLEKINVKESKIDLLSVSAHKINGPKGVGFLYARGGIKLAPRQYGGEQEKKRRAGTENVASIAALYEAVKISQKEIEHKRETFLTFKNVLIEKFRISGIDFHVNGLLEKSLPHVLNLSFPGTNVESLLMNMDLVGIAVSSGSACTAGSIDPSHVLVAMYGKKAEQVTNSVRFSFGLYNTTEDIIKVADETVKIVQRLKDN